VSDADDLARYEKDLRKLVVRYRHGDVTVEDLEDISRTVLRELDEQAGDDVA
jgi:ribosome maturation factor RimP